jgi:Leishmanolysin
LLKFARDYFDCPTLEGIPLENNKSPGSYASHWEKKYFPNEFMNPTIENPGKISEITMKYLEATGWYTVENSTWEHYT